LTTIEQGKEGARFKRIHTGQHQDILVVVYTDEHVLGLHQGFERDLGA
jgi:hypothetical protein